jgi:hypothetical protein
MSQRNHTQQAFDGFAKSALLLVCFGTSSELQLLLLLQFFIQLIL